MVNRIKLITFCLLKLIICSEFVTGNLLDRIGYFWHLSDFRLDLNYSVFSDVNSGCRNPPSNESEKGEIFAGQYGDYFCYSHVALVRSVTHAILEKGGSNPDFVLWTGDNCGPLEYGECSEEYVVQTTITLRKQMATIFTAGGIIGYPVFGLRDASAIYTANQSSKREGQRLTGIFSRTAEIFYPWMEDDMPITFAKGGFYSNNYDQKLKIIALNTFLFSKLVPYENDPLGQWTWLEGELRKSREFNQKVYLVYSAPPGIYEKIYHPPGFHWFHYKHNQKFLQVIQRFSDVIAGQFAGQYKSDVFRIIYGVDGNPVSWILLNPSVSPYSRSPLPFAVSNHPAIRLYKYNRLTAQVLDYTQFYLDLTLANYKSYDKWDYGYTFSAYYSLPNISPKSLQILLNRLEQDERFLDRNFQASAAMTPQNEDRITSTDPKWKKGLQVFRDGKFFEGCGPICKRYHLCSAACIEYDKFLTCILASESNSRKNNENGTSSYLVLILNLVIFHIINENVFIHL